MRVSDPPSPAWSRSVKRYDYDTWLLQSRMMARGLSVTRLPGGVIMAGGQDSDQVLSFVGAVPKTTTFEGPALSLKLASAWTLLHEAGLSTPRWKVFSSRAIESAGRFAESLGFPVVVCGLKGEHHQLVRDREELASTLTALGAERRLRKVVVRSQVEGEEVKVLVIGDTVVSSDFDSSSKDYSEIERIALLSKSVIPGLAIGEVRMTIGQSTDSEDSRHGIVVTGFSSSPRLHHYTDSDEGALALVDRLIETEAEAAGVVLSEPMDEIHTVLTFSGVVDSSRFSQAVQQDLVDSPCGGHEVPELLTSESVRMDVTGPPGGIAHLSVQALRGIGTEQHRAHIIKALNKQVIL